MAIGHNRFAMVETMSTIEITSVGQASALFQRHPKSIKDAARSLQIEPAFVINGVPHYTPEQLETIAKHLQRSTAPSRRDEL